MQRPIAAAAASRRSRCAAPTRRLTPRPMPCLRRSDRASHAPDAASSSALPAHADDVVDYTLRATLDPAAHTVAGSGTIHFRNTSTQPVHELWLHLYLNAFKNERSDFLRERVGGRGSEHAGIVGIHRPSHGWRSAKPDGTSTDLLARIELHAAGRRGRDGRARSPAARGAAGRVDRSRRGVRRQAPDRRRANRLPRPLSHGRPVVSQDRAPRARRDLGALSVSSPRGVLRGLRDLRRHHRRPRRVHHRRHRDPPSRARVEAGRRIERHVQGDVHDFAWTAWDRWQKRARQSRAST